MTKKRSLAIGAIIAVVVGAVSWLLIQRGPSDSTTQPHRTSSGSSQSEIHAIYSRVHFDSDPPCTDTAPAGCMLYVPGGTFTMGAQNSTPDAAHYDAAATEDEGPPHQVTLPSFWIHKEEVKPKQFAACVDAEACKVADLLANHGYYNWGQKGRLEHALNGVSWTTAQAYCTWLGGRLPTEAEWEYAARGTEHRRFPWGNAPPACNTAKLSTRKCGIDGTSGRPTPGSASPFAVEDMAGSVWEWTGDWYAEDFYAKSPTMAPSGPKEGTRRVIRGGGWMDEDFNDLRVTARAALQPDTRMSDLGFRCIRPHPE